MTTPAELRQLLAKAATPTTSGCLGAEALLIKALTSHRHDFVRLIRAVDDARGAMLYRDNFAEVLPRLIEALAPFEE